MSREKQKLECEMAEMLEIIEKAREIYANDVTDHTENEYIREGLLDAGYRKQEWISVDERLPEDGELVLGYSAKSRRCGLCNCLKSYVREFGNYDDTTHWMPLPEPPKKKG